MRLLLEVKAFDKFARDIALQSELRTEALIAAAIRDGIAAGIYAPGDPQVWAGLVKPLLQDRHIKRWKYRQRGITSHATVDTVTVRTPCGIPRGIYRQSSGRAP